MINRVGVNPNPLKINNTSKVDRQESYMPNALLNSKNKVTETANPPSNEELDIKSLYESEQTSKVRINYEEQEKSIDEQNEPPRCNLTKADLAIIDDKLNTSDDPLKYYNAAFDLFCKGVLKTEDLPKTFGVQSDNGEVKITPGRLTVPDPSETMEDPDYVKDLIKTVLAKLKEGWVSPVEQFEESTLS